MTDVNERSVRSQRDKLSGLGELVKLSEHI